MKSLKIKAEIKYSKKEQKPVKKLVIVLSSLFFALVIFVSFFIYCLLNENILEQRGMFYFQVGQFAKAESYYKADAFLKKVFLVNLKSKKNKDFYSYFESKEDLIKCLIERGDIYRAIYEYKIFQKEVKKNCPQDEEINNLINLQIANCYSMLGLYDKSIQIYEKLKDWYPQNLIQAYIDTKQYDKAASVLFSEEVQDKIEEGEDSDAVALGYVLLSYYKALEKYNLAERIYTKNTPSFENDVISILNLADLYYLKKEYDSALNLYEKIISSCELSQDIMYKMQLKYALLLYQTGKSFFAEQAMEDIIKNQKGLYSLSPEIICTNYIASNISSKKSDYYLKIAQEKFKKLNLPEDSYFKDNIEYFCKVNTNY